MSRIQVSTDLVEKKWSMTLNFSNITRESYEKMFIC
jgi:hypothetical protein